ncbi:hypothetical protein [Phyllobacterium endophyticum]|uniref:hypothetical protein n=1 Tax=Phyllobacterium endophyticum TaxID=1149773 RepID=UPI0011C7ED96|nr:hypothetical protein [Phyllobacterium endophyticum]TXR47200.1 hypothetical protein FVA77_20885 [Phyllobacterium endophyticum]
MVSRTVASVLTDFTPRPVPADRVTLFTTVIDRSEVLAAEIKEGSEDAVDLIDYELKIKEAFVAGREAGQAEAAVLFEAEKVRLEREFEDQLAAAEALFMQQTGARLTREMVDGLASISADISASLAAVLSPFIEEKLRERSVNAFVEEVERMTKGLAAINLEISGPPHLLDVLRMRSEIDQSRFTLTEANQSELCLRLDEAVVETRLGRLIDALRNTANEH